MSGTCDDGQQSTAGAAIGLLSELLLPFVELRKACGFRIYHRA